MKSAGTTGAGASVIHHTGRRSGAAHHTPIGPVQVDDGFVVALPYGQHADWVRNVLVAGRATITHEGRTYEVDRPQIIPIDSVDASFGATERTAQRLLNVDDGLHLRHVDMSSEDQTGASADETLHRVHTPAL